MKRWSSAALAALALVAVTACRDTITSPQADPELRYASNPPPPPADGFAAGEFISGGSDNLLTTGGLRTTVSLSTACVFNVPVKYFYNLPQLNGWVHFRDDPANGIDAGPNGMVKQQGTTITGKGTLVVDCGLGATLTIDLSSLSPYPTSFIGCPSTAAAGPPTGTPLVCFNFVFEDATLSDGSTTDQGSVEMTGYPVIVCPPEECFLGSRQVDGSRQ